MLAIHTKKALLINKSAIAGIYSMKLYDIHI